MTRSSPNVRRHSISGQASITTPNARATHFLYLRKLRITRTAVQPFRFDSHQVTITPCARKMLDLAELRLHLRDEYTRRGSVKDRLRRPRHIIPDPLPPQNKDTTTASSDEITPEITPETSRFDSDSDENSLTSIAEALGQRSELDDAEDPAAAFTPIFEQIQLQQLFNFSDDTWTKLMERIGMRSLDDELEFYELVELDADGEADDDPDFRRHDE
ncbi:hypothetical protein M405DRAFT_98167 [Rhizopogon salebrosus TDB-379]|nr:hypothetical protein M405DRAFT_98167 [Rhizopogon salebrosus TDB-379]